MLALALCVLIVVGASASGRPQRSARYPLSLEAAIVKAYAPGVPTILASCTTSTDGRDEFAIADVRIDGRRSQAAFQFVNTAGWYRMWRDGRAFGDAAVIRPALRAIRLRCVFSPARA